MINAVTLPVRLVGSHHLMGRLGLRSMRDERVRTALRFCRGRLLDVGCGEGNALVRAYSGPGVGVDVFLWPGIDLQCDTAKMPFADGSFETVAMLASLNHIPNRREVLAECRRVLTPEGRLLVTMIGPHLGRLRHALAWWDKDQKDRKAAEGELKGMSDSALRRVLTESGFVVKERVRFVCGLNNLYVAERGKD